MRIWRIREPELIFSRGSRDVNPCNGLIKYGPCGPDVNKEAEFLPIRIGLIGTVNTINGIKTFLYNLSKKTYPIDKDKEYLTIFPGLSHISKINCKITLSKTWEDIITKKEFENCLNKPSRIEKGQEFIKLFENKLKAMIVREPPPHIILLAVLKEELGHFQKYGKKTHIVKFAKRTFSDKSILAAQMSGGDLDFHNIIKTIGLKFRTPTQLVTERTWIQKEGETQDPSMVAWNFSVGLYYKATGIPWKVIDLYPGTCYAGVDFYPDNIAQGGQMGVSMAQIFLHTGRSYVLRGQPFPWNFNKDRNPHLDENKAYALMKEIIDEYNNHMGQDPQRIVIHKSTEFQKEELRGFMEGAKNIPNRNFVSISKKGVRFYTDDQYPVVRGTIISISNNEHLLYTSGFIPALNTYVGAQVPIPLSIKLFECDSTYDQLLTEIMAFSKLDWNNAEFCSKYPITLKVSHRVGIILAEARARQIQNLPKQYRFYM